MLDAVRALLAAFRLWLEGRAGQIAIRVASVVAVALVGFGLPLPSDFEANLALVIGAVLVGGINYALNWLIGRLPIEL